MLTCLPTPDAGISDAGDVDAAPRPDAAGLLFALDGSMGGNSAPTVMVQSPSSRTSSTMVVVTWTAEDPDGDVVSVSILKAPLSSANSGDEVVSGLTGSGTATWDTTGVTPGNYRVLVRADDGHGHVVIQVAPGQVDVGGGQVPITVEEPKGGESVGDTLPIKVRTEAADGMVSIFYDTDGSGLNGEPIAGGLRARGGVVEISWNVLSVPAGTYYVYAVLEGTGANASAYSAGAITVQRPRRCGCSTTQPGSSPAGLLVAAAGLWAVRRVKSTRRAP
jgi:MYXO-CTERM domain-containing protein